MTLMSDDSLAYTIAGIGRKRDPYAERRAMAQRLIAQGTDTSPIQSPWQGAARLAQALMGGFDSYAADRDEKRAITDRNSKLAEIMAEPDPQKRLTGIATIDPEAGLRYSGQLAVEQAKIKAQREGLGAAAEGFGSSYGLPPVAPTGNAGQAIAGIESGGRYDAVGPVANDKGHRAYGKYQVLEPNIGPWTQEVLGRPMTPQEFLANPQAQDAVFNAKFGQYQQKYGPEGASRAWFAGEGGMNNPNARDVNGMTVAGYGQKFAQAYGPGAGGPQGAPPAPPVTVQATPPGQPQPLTVNIGGPGGVPQGSADASGNPLPPPQPGVVSGPTLVAPQVPEVPRPQPSPQQLQQYQQRLVSGEFGTDPREAPSRARAALAAELDRDWAVQRERAKMAYDQQQGDYNYRRKQADDEAARRNKREEEAPQKMFDNANKLRDEFNASPQVKAYREVTPILESMKDAAQRPTKAADLNLVYALAKIMDPGSVVREGEMVMVNNTQGIGARVAGLIESVKGGAMLTPETRQKIIDEAMSRYRGLEQTYKALEDHYGGMADRYSLRREDVIVPIRTPQAQGAAQPQAAPQAAAGQLPRIANDDDFARLPSGATFIAPDGSTRRKP